MRITTKALTTTALLGLLIGAGSAAYAGTASQDFDAITPAFSQAWNSANQSKSYNSADGRIHVNYVGSNYSVNARMCNVNGGLCGSEPTLNDGETKALPNGFGSGTTVHLTLHTATLTYVRVESTGYWSSN